MSDNNLSNQYIMNVTEYYKYIKQYGYKGYNPQGTMTKTLKKFIRANLHVDLPNRWVFNPATNRFIYETKANYQKVKKIKEDDKELSYFVRYTYTTKVHYKRKDKPKSKAYYEEKTEIKEIKAKKSKILIQIMNAINDDIDFQNEDLSFQYKDTTLENVSNATIINRAEFTRETAFNNLSMRNSTVLKYNFMPKIDDFSYKTTEMMCVYQTFEMRYGSLPRAKKTANDLYILCNKHHKDTYNEELDKKQGVNCEELAYACLKMDIPFMCFDIKNNLIIKQTSKNRNLPPLVIYNVNGHMYIITDKKLLESLRKKYAEINFSSSCFKDEAKESPIIGCPVYDFDNVKELETLELIENKALVIANEPDLWFLFVSIVKKKNQIPKVKHKTERTIQEVIYEREDGGIIYIQCDANYATDYTYNHIMELCETLNIPFKNQALGSLIDTYYESFNNKEKINLKGKDRLLFFEKNKNKCCFSGCCNNNKNSKIHINYKISIANGGEPNESNLQLLCSDHYYEKLEEEKNEEEETAPLISSFNSEVSNVFNSEHMEKWAFCEKITEKKSRACFDIIRCRKNNLYFAEHEWAIYTVLDKVEPWGGKIKCGFFYVVSKNYLPLRGNGWYCEPLINYCLKLGIIKTDDIKYQLIPSLTLPPDFFKPFIDDVYLKFGDFAKQAINSFIGCFYRRQTERIMSIYTHDIKEACYAFTKYDAKIATHYNDLNIYQVIYQQTLKFEENRSPLYLQILDLEALELHKLAQIVGNDATFLKTDAVYSSNSFNIIQKPYNKGINYDYPDGTPKYKNDEVTRTDYERKAGFTNTHAFEYNPLNWHNIEDNDDFNVLAEKVMELKSVHIDGRAGSGKTTLINLIKSKLDIKEYLCLAPTNKAARLINGETIHKKLGLDGKHITIKGLKDIKYIFVDEISMMIEQFYKLLLIIKHLRPDMCFILVGDFLQLEPVKDRVFKANYKDSGALFELCDGNRLNMTKWRRADEDPTTKTKEYFKKKHCKTSICFTNETRKKINDLWIKEEAPANSVKVSRLSFDNNSQDYKLYEGLPLIARKNYKELDIANNEQFIIYYIDKKEITMECGLIVPIEKMALLFHPAYAITVHKSQGSTINEEYTIYEWAKMDKRLKYVSITRGSNIKFINII